MPRAVIHSKDNKYHNIVPDVHWGGNSGGTWHRPYAPEYAPHNGADDYDRFELFILPDGEKKIEILPDSRKSAFRTSRHTSNNSQASRIAPSSSSIAKITPSRTSSPSDSVKTQRFSSPPTRSRIRSSQRLSCV